ncbi:MAG: TolC family protein [Planctomycetota bacterium]
MRGVNTLLGLMGMTSLVVCGCLRHAATPASAVGEIDTSHYEHLAKQIEFPDHPTPSDDLLAATPSPMSLATPETVDYLGLSLEETMHLALANSPVLRELGGAILRTADNSRTKYDPSITESDPQTGIEGALSAFDAQFTSNFSFEKNDRALNNVFFGGGTRLLRQDFATWQTQVSKTAATGTRYAFKNYTQYDANNAPGNFVGSAFTTWYDLEARHPLLQGSGTSFNRLAGPNAQPGVINGVVIARINSDMALTSFEVGVRNFVSDVENTYWDLYFAYRDLDAKVNARNGALNTWRRINALYERGRRGGEAEKEAQAREQYFRFEEEAQNSLHGKLVDGTRTFNGTTGGTFHGTGGVYVVERRLRLLIGLPINDGRLIRPTEEPIKAKVVFNWEASLVEGLTRRAELRRHKWQIKKREAELEANKNFLKPQLDLIGRYRWRGFGKDLYPNSGTGRFNNATTDLFSGDFQEWQAGVELSFPIGYRQAYSAVRQSELQLARERALLHEHERAVIHDLSNAISEADRAYALVETNMNRRMAAAEQVAAVQTAFEADNATLDSLLDAQRRLSDADVSYYRSLVEYQLAVKNVQVEKGTLLDYNEIFLSEGAWPTKAYEDAEDRESTRGEPHNYTPHPKKHSPWVSQGMYPQMLSPSGGVVTQPQPVPYAPSGASTPAEATPESPGPTPVERERGTSSLPTTESSADLDGPPISADSTPFELPFASPE